MRPGKNRLGWWLLALALALVVLLGSRTLWLGAMGRYLVDAGEPAKADAVLVLAGDFTGHRVCKGAELVRAGYAPKAFVSGPEGMYGWNEAQLAIQFAVSQGFAENMFVAVPNPSKSTREEALDIIPRLRQLHIHSVDLVTSNFHTRRSAGVYRTLAPDIEFHVVAAPTPDYVPSHWWANREGRKMFLYEWMKTVAYWFGM